MTRLQALTWEALRALVQVLVGPDPGPARRQLPPRQRGVWFAGLLAAALLLAAVNATHVYRSGAVRTAAGAPQVLLAVAVVLPLLAAGRPMPAWRLGWLALLLSPLLPASWWGGWPWGPPQLLALLAVFCLAGVGQRRAQLWWMWALILIPWGWWLVRDIPNLNGPVSATLVFTVVVVAVDNIGSRLRAQQALETQTVLTDAERARRAVMEERARIARELHDVVAHHLSLIAVRTETAPFRLRDLPEPARAEFASVSGVAREALTEMRRLLGVLRQDRSAVLSPQPRLTELPGLVEATRRAGVAVDLHVPEELGEVPAGVGVCAYRIVQESLSNASRHAPGSAVSVTVCQDRDAVRVHVANGPGRPPVGPGRGAPETGRHLGHGLAGMRERVALLGGSLSAGPTRVGGFEVSAVLPLGGSA